VFRRFWLDLFCFHDQQPEIPYNGKLQFLPFIYISYTLLFDFVELRLCNPNLERNKRKDFYIAIFFESKENFNFEAVVVSKS